MAAATTAANHAVKAKLLAVTASQQLYEQSEADAKLRVAYLRDVHLCFVLQNVSIWRARELLGLACRVADSGEVQVVAHAQRLGCGWVGKAVFSSATSSRRLELASPAMQDAAETVFSYSEPSLLDEWTVGFSLVYDPPDHAASELIRTPAAADLGALHVDTLDAILIRTPAAADLGALHVDTLDAIVPCHVASQPTCLLPSAAPAVCELWLSSTRFSATAASRLLRTLLFETVAAKRAAAIMLDKHSARFCVPGAGGPSEAVTVMCAFERDHLALRIRSADWLAYAAVVHCVAARLSLLLGNPVQQALTDIQAKYAATIAAASQGCVPLGEAGRLCLRPNDVDFVDCVAIEGDWPDELFA
ncbi:hypothetical protein EV174_005004 [Coemansia sp. RSA 2320]|nr:hypothetical protein EV174_005004 [Coemansia sp. RSA 2320]